MEGRARGMICRTKGATLGCLVRSGVMRAVVMAAGLWALAGTAMAATLDVPATGPVAVPGTGLTAVLVAVWDARCPSDVACVWEGEKRATLSISGADGMAEITLCNACEGAIAVATAFGVRFEVEDLVPTVEEIEALGRDAVLADYGARVRVGE
jgi:hypothetical protein